MSRLQILPFLSCKEKTNRGWGKITAPLRLGLIDEIDVNDNASDGKSFEYKTKIEVETPEKTATTWKSTQIS